MTDLLAHYAARRAHVLIVEVPGQWRLRALFECRLAALGWCAATSAADADVLAVCGRPGPELAAIVDCMWDQLPGPRVRIELDNPDMVDSALSRATAKLSETECHRVDARERPHAAGSTGDHDGMDMAPAGIPLAEGGEDRDGLEMDVLHLRVGPIVPHWPAGLVLRCSLQGDVVAGAEAWLLDRDHREQTLARGSEGVVVDSAARHCDHVVDLLALAGWQRAAAAARTARDLLLSEGRTSQTHAALDGLYRTLSGSRLLRWSLRGLGRLTAEDVDRLRLPAALAGDTYDRLRTRVDHIQRMVSNPLSASHLQLGFDQIDALPDLVRGLDVATARLIIASIGVDTTPVNESNRSG